MEYFFYLTMGAFAVYRVARMIALEDGPFDCFARFRSLFVFNPHLNDYESWVGRGFHCPLCLSFWISLLIALAYALTGMISFGSLILWWLALAGLSTFLYKREID